MKGFMKYAETNSGAMMFIPNFMKFGLGFQNLKGRDTDSMVIS
jgi:hypothetical protein